MNSSSLWRALAGVALLIVGAATPANARTWTNYQGKQIEADYVRLDGANVVLLMDGREVSVPLANLSTQDKQYVFEQQLAKSPGRPATPAKAIEAGRTADDADAPEESPAENASSSRENRESAASGVARIRAWKDDQGNTIRAKFIRIHEGNAVLMQGRKTVSCAIAKLSVEDQEYLRELLTARGEGHLVPSAEQLAAARQGGRDGSYGADGSTGGAVPAYTPPYTVDAGMTDSGAAYGSGYASSTETPPYAYGGPAYAAASSTAPGSGYPGYDPANSGASSETSSTGYGGPAYTPAYESSYTASGAAQTPTAPYPGSMTMPEVAYNPVPAPSYSPGVQEQVEYYCSNCKQSVPAHINDKCPHCGVRFDYVEQPDGTRKYNSRLWTGGGIGTAIAVIIGVIVRMIVYAQRNG